MKNLYRVIFFFPFFFVQAQPPRHDLLVSVKAKGEKRIDDPNERMLNSVLEKDGRVKWNRLHVQENWQQLQSLYTEWKKGKKGSPTLFSYILERRKSDEDFIEALITISFCLDGVDADAASSYYFRLLRHNAKATLDITEKVLNRLNADKKGPHSVCINDGEGAKDAFQEFALNTHDAAVHDYDTGSNLSSAKLEKSAEAYRKYKAKAFKSDERAARLAPIFNMIDAHENNIFSINKKL